MEKFTDLYSLKPGMVIAEDIFTNGSLLARKGMEISSSIISKLEKFRVDSIKVFHAEPLTFKKTKKIEPEELIKNDINNKIRLLSEKLLSNHKHSAIMKEIIISIFQNHCLKDEQIIKALMILRSNTHFDHVLQVTVLTVGTGITLSLDEKQLISLAKAALVYDIGKCFVNSNLLLKKEPELSNQERELIKEHVNYVDLRQYLGHKKVKSILERHPFMEHPVFSETSQEKTTLDSFR